jgi:hypothetical protein
LQQALDVQRLIISDLAGKNKNEILSFGVELIVDQSFSTVFESELLLEVILEKIPLIFMVDVLVFKLG